jgi:hypothetical protein
MFCFLRMQAAAVVTKELLPDDVGRDVPSWRGVARGEVQLTQQFSLVSV